MKKIPLSIAKEIGVDPSYIFRINKGERTPSIPVVKKIIAAMRDKGITVTLSDLRPDIVELLK